MTARITEQMITHLQNGDFQSAANLFVEGQNEGIFPGDHTLASKLAKEIGKSATGKLVIAFSHYPCQFCTKGRTKCKDCNGHGHINHNIVCEPCLGLGSVRCDFCNGSGWMAIEDIPDGLRSTVLIVRARSALTRIKSALVKPIPQLLENKPSTTLKECAQIVMYLDRYTGVLENIVVSSEKMDVPEGEFKNKLNVSRQKCIEAAIQSRQRLRDILLRMAESARLEAEMADKELATRNLAEKRIEFYGNMAKKQDGFAGLKDEHPFLEKAVEKYIFEKHQKPNNN
ncbi:MAG: hypothetical protein WCE45_08710 [Sedimentisphaerales bacterium]